jgi:nitroimidazol reductase NimA-like FMN-containing flavoprotein (pyridoxamine 5'-phosphate oxidase superfamily)
MDALKYHRLKNRPEREITDKEDINKLLANGKFAVLSLCRENEPYIVTLSYGYDESSNALYFHCAKEGLKTDFIKSNPNVCATVIEDGGYIDGECGHYYKTLVLRGTITFVLDNNEKKHAMNILLTHLEKDNDIIKEKLNKALNSFENMEILKLSINEIHGKAGR